jgi:hypothetical protein
VSFRVIEEIKGRRLAHGAEPGRHPLQLTEEEQIPWVERLRRAKSQAFAQSADPWRLRIERVRGKTGYDGVERVSTQDVFDFLEVHQRARTAGAGRRPATLMRELAWTPIKARGMTQSGFKDQVRGTAGKLGRPGVLPRNQGTEPLHPQNHRTTTPSHGYPPWVLRGSLLSTYLL